MGLQDQARIVKTYTAEDAIRQYRFVKLNAANKVEECDTAGEAVFGIAETAASDEGRVDVCIFGFTKIEIGADTTINTWLATASDGQATDADSSDDYYAALGLEDGTAATERITCWFPGPSHLDKYGD